MPLQREDWLLLLGAALVSLGILMPTPPDLLSPDNPAAMAIVAGLALLLRGLWVAFKGD